MLYNSILNGRKPDKYNGVEQINKNGVKYYSALIQKYMKVDESVVRALPDIKYTKIGPPRKADLLMARNFLSSGKVSK